MVAHHPPGCTPKPSSRSGSRSCWTGPRSTPNPAARSPTPARSPARRWQRVGQSRRHRRAEDRQDALGAPGQRRVGGFVEGDTVVASADKKWRHGATQGHSGTHMVHAALREVLGPNAVQAGSLNRPGYLRFDFNWQGALSEDQRTAPVSRRSAQRGCRSRLPGQHVHHRTGQGQGDGRDGTVRRAVPEQVRVVEIGGPFSLELCGGTHV